MPNENNNSNSGGHSARARAGDSYQPLEHKTYTPDLLFINGNYSPVVPVDATGQLLTPPTGGSGVPGPKNSAAAQASPANNNSH